MKEFASSYLVACYMFLVAALKQVSQNFSSLRFLNFPSWKTLLH